MTRAEYATARASWQPRYVLYAAACGRTVEEQAAHDANMAPYLVWLSRERTAYAAECPDRVSGEATIRDHDHFTAWLEGGWLVGEVEA